MAWSPTTRDGSPEEPCAECDGSGGTICPDCGHASWIEEPEESVEGAGAAVDGARSAQATRPDFEEVAACDRGVLTDDGTKGEVVGGR